MSDKKRVMELIKEGKISVEEALNLIESLESNAAPTVTEAKIVLPFSKMLRISVDSKDAKIKVNIPIGLAKFASRFIPQEAQNEMRSQGIDVEAILEMLKTDLTDGKLVDIEAEETKSIDANGKAVSTPIKILVEVV